MLWVILLLIVGAVAVYAVAGKKIMNRIRSERDIASYKKPVNISLDKPIISFTFDDIPETACVAADMLKQNNIKGTFYICMNLMDSTANNQVFFKQESLKQLINDGHEIASHTFAHINCKTSDAAAITADLKQNQTVFEKFSGLSMKNFAFPYGEFDAEAKQVTASMFTSSRSIIPGINNGTTDMNLLKAIKLYENIPVQEALDRINENTQKKGWLIFYTHDVQDDPSIYGCSPKYFQAVLNAAKASGADILSVQQAIDKIVRN